MNVSYEESVWECVMSDPQFIRGKTLARIDSLRPYILQLPVLFQDDLDKLVNLNLLAKLRLQFLSYFQELHGVTTTSDIIVALERANYLFRHIEDYLDQFEIYKREYIANELELTRFILLRIDEGITVRQFLLEYPYVIIRPI